jgi:hypothetical protein
MQSRLILIDSYAKQFEVEKFLVTAYAGKKSLFQFNSLLSRAASNFDLRVWPVTSVTHSV